MKSIMTEKIRASREFLQKENIREEIQKMIIDAVGSGKISSKQDLDEFFKTVSMAANALQQVPFEVYQKLSEK